MPIYTIGDEPIVCDDKLAVSEDCCEESPVPIPGCDQCIDEDMADFWQVDIALVGPGVCGGTCSVANGTFVMTMADLTCQGSTASVATGCFGNNITVTIALTAIMGGVRVTVTQTHGPTLADSCSWQDDFVGLIDCHSFSASLPLTGSVPNGLCNWTNATCLVTAL